ncbi:hypothetical protein [Paracoccus indicus]|uniref:hypothetical protein n=1 Tax=Paracoccus indicus TaxID=2079229 RepID=UPI000D3539AF|nr:hypothetical protein [Paracoccus indicus]
MTLPVSILRTGGEGSDGFNASEDKLAFRTELDPEDPPQITVSADEDSQTTSGMLGDKETLTMNGVFASDDLQIGCKHIDELELNASPDSVKRPESGP